mmetsp:Transcript_25467/g.83827  ORF Transcript_25467/g.83827 Transcript_25467/m.83827 type:complete len:282 (+) Transcript_25467:59-904(+)
MRCVDGVGLRGEDISRGGEPRVHEVCERRGVNLCGAVAQKAVGADQRDSFRPRPEAERLVQLVLHRCQHRKLRIYDGRPLRHDNERFEVESWEPRPNLAHQSLAALERHRRISAAGAPLPLPHRRELNPERPSHHCRGRCHRRRHHRNLPNQSRPRAHDERQNETKDPPRAKGVHEPLRSRRRRPREHEQRKPAAAAAPVKDVVERRLPLRSPGLREHHLRVGELKAGADARSGSEDAPAEEPAQRERSGGRGPLVGEGRAPHVEALVRQSRLDHCERAFL